MIEKNVGGSTPSSTIYLLNCPELDMGYENTWFWSGINPVAEQQQYFQSKGIGKNFNNYSYLRKESAIKVACHVDDIYNANYLMYKNKEGKWYYCFIVEKEYINENTTRIYISTDLIQTYFFNFEIKDSYVERMHVNRWKADGTPADEFEPEGLEYGENIQIEETKIKELENNYLIITSNPLEKAYGRKKPDDGGGGTPSGGNWQEGTPSGDGFYFVKSWEAFAPWSYDLGDGTRTVGYGTTSKYNPSEYAQLTQNPPCTEEEASKVMYTKYIKSYCKPIVNRLKVDLKITKQNQADALFDLAYNAGTGDILNDNELMKVIMKNPTDRGAIEPVWKEFRIRKGTPLEQGLRERRKAQIAVYFDSNYGNRQIPIYNEHGKPSGKVVTDNNGKGWTPS